MKHKILFLLFIFSLISCKKKYPITNYQGLIYPTVIQKETITEGCFFDMLCIQDSILLLKAECDSFFFHLYKMENLKYVGRFGEKGKSPWDFQFPFPYNSNTTKYPQNDTILFYDMNLMCKKSININNIINKKEAISENITQDYLDEKLFFSKELNQIGTNITIGSNINKLDGIFFIYNKFSKEIKWIDFYPKYSIDKEYRNSVYSSVVCANETKNKIAFAYRHFDCILFYSLTGDLIKEIYFSQPKLPDLSPNFHGVSNDSPIYFSKIYGTTEKCYFLRIGKGLNYILNNEGKTEINIFELDWNGNLQNVYYFDKEFSSFCIDNSGEYLYALQANNNENEPFVNLLKIRLSHE